MKREFFMQKYPVQLGILEPLPSQARHIFFELQPGSSPQAALKALAQAVDGEKLVVGLGLSLIQACGGNIPGLRDFPEYIGAKVAIPATPFALWAWLREEDRGDIVLQSLALEKLLAPTFVLKQIVDCFRYGEGNDLSGFEDGTENPKAEAAVKAAVVAGSEEGLAGSSFVAIQQWLHDFEILNKMDTEQQSQMIGRDKGDNHELEDALPSSHIKRTEQESFDPTAFVLRRSMPWANQQQAGLLFVSFGKSFDAFEAQLHRMVGAEDGIIDALFQFTQPLTGSYFWCPPLNQKGLDLQALGL
jgi:porphyrinogen peroxidase